MIAGGSKLSHVAIFKAFCDESYTHHASDKRIYSIAGFIGSPEAWAPFSERWMALLRPKGLTHFHMTAYENNSGPFENMPADEAAALFNSLIDVIVDTDIYPFAASLEIEKWDELPDDAKESGRNPYMVLLGMLIRRIPLDIHAPDGSHDVKVHFICEFPPEKGFVEECLRGFADTMESDDPCASRLLGLDFRGKMAHREFDAADIIAYATMKQARKDLQGDPRIRYEIQRLLSRLPFIMMYTLNSFDVGPEVE